MNIIETDSSYRQTATVSFRRMTEQDFSLLHKWFQNPRIREWYARGEAFSLEMIRQKYLPRILHSQSIPNYIIYINETAVGYIQCYHVSEHLPEGMDQDDLLFRQYMPEELAGIDMFIGEDEFLHKGHASKALSAFLRKKLRGRFQAVVVDPMKSNRQAVLFFERNGFAHISRNRDSEHDLMLLEL